MLGVMSTAKEKEDRTAKRGCVWLLIGGPSLLLVYLFLLSTSVFDSAPQDYPDLEIQSQGQTIPLLEALEASPGWTDWKANEATREKWLAEFRSDTPSLPAGELAENLRPGLAGAIDLATQLCDRPELLGVKPWPENASPFDISFEEAGELRRIFTALRAAPYLAAHSNHADDRSLRSSPVALRLLAKSKLSESMLIGRLFWLAAEAYSHEVLAAEIHQFVLAGDEQGLRQLLPLLDACRPAGDPGLADAWKSEWKFARTMMVHLKNQLGNFGAGVTAFGFGGGSSLSGDFMEQWTILRLQPNKCVALLAEETRVRIRNAALPARDRIWPPPNPSPWKQMISLAPNAGGEVLLDLARPSYAKAPQVEDDGLARHHLLRLLIALALYRMDHGDQLPPDLARLVPAYLTALPADPYTGEAPMYHPAAGTLAFRGQDFAASSTPVAAEKEKTARQRGLPPGVAGMFERVGAHDPGVDLRAFFAPAPSP